MFKMKYELVFCPRSWPMWQRQKEIYCLLRFISMASSTFFHRTEHWTYVVEFRNTVMYCITTYTRIFYCLIFYRTFKMVQKTSFSWIRTTYDSAFNFRRKSLCIAKVFTKCVDDDILCKACKPRYLAIESDFKRPLLPFNMVIDSISIYHPCT